MATDSFVALRHGKFPAGASACCFKQSSLGPGCQRDQTVVARHGLRHHMMLYSVPTETGRHMRTTVNIDDELLAKATKLAGPMDRTAILSEGLRALIERESAKRLARLGGTQPALKVAPRRRQEKLA